MIFADSELTVQTFWIAAGTVIAGLGVLLVLIGVIWAGGQVKGLISALKERADENDDEHRQFREMLNRHGEQIGSLEGWRYGNNRGQRE